MPSAMPAEAADARVAMDRSTETDAVSTPVESDQSAIPDAVSTPAKPVLPASPVVADAPAEPDQSAARDAVDTPESTEAAGSAPVGRDAPAPAVDAPAVENGAPTNSEPADADLVAPEAAAPVAFDDIVIPPRPPLPVARAAEAPTAEATNEHVALDPTPADVAVEEPAVSDPPAVQSPAGEPSTAVDEPVADDDLEPAASEAEVIVVTPLDTREHTDAPRVASDVSDTGESAADVAPREVADAGTFDDTHADDAHDPTPPDVRADDEAPADETSHAPVLDVAEAEASADPDGVVAPGVDTDSEASDHPAPDAEPAAVTDAEAPAETPAVAADETTADGDAEASRDTSTDAAVPALAATDEASTDSATDTAASTDADGEAAVPALTLRHITKTFGELRAVDAIDLTVPAGSFYGLVGPNGAGKTTTLSIIAGLLRADGGAVTINGVDAKKRAREAKKMIGVLPDRLRTFDRLTGRQLLSYYGALRGLPSGLVESRMADLARAFDLVDALARPVSDYSAGMTKKVMLAGAMIHSPRLLVLDEPFEAVDPVSSGVILDILRTYVDHGGTVILSSHGMELVERVCSRVAVIVSGQVLAEGTVDEVRGEGTLEQRFRELSGGLGDVEGLEWLHTFSA
ncbi:ATP-binding cassette domain-containing protein [Microbacterium sp. lyk4-40-TSB-66]|uniref:ABC transporter ATP-binding protein n=1 Tax=Microbacterium sp. lyk4-40-TSB-66 TaxID=3040294 RepID=UPI00254F50BC|nr:ATP-binding cassette domain-containing protein [Microbacterium sp. lyk4-40-TSB-66]